MKPLTLSRRLFLVTAVALLPALGILTSSVLVSQSNSETNLHLQAARTAELAALEMERIINGAENVLRALSVIPAVRSAVVEDCSALVTEMAKVVPSLAAVAVIDADGYPRCSPLELGDNPYLGDREYFLEALATDGRVVGTYTVGRTSGTALLPIALRIGGSESGTYSVAVAYINLGWLEARLEERSHFPGSSLTIADRNGTILARVPEPELFVGTVIPETFRYLLTEPEPGTLELTSQDGTRRVIGYNPITVLPAGIYVSAGFPTESAFASTQAIATRGMLIAIAGILAALILALYTSKVFIVRPVQTLVDTVQAWRNGQMEARTQMGPADGEAGIAGQAFDTFIEELLAAREARQASEDQRQMLVAELDHRVKNLLAMVHSVARQSFGRIATEPEMRAFSGRLQAMAEANSMLRQETWQSVPMDELVNSALKPFIEISSAKLSISGPPVLVRSEVVLALSLALHELTTNASKYGALSVDAGSVSIRWTVRNTSTGHQFDFTWQERGGPPVLAPVAKGFGSAVIERVLSGQIGGEVEIRYEREGLVCRVSAPVENVLVDGPMGSEASGT